MTEKVDFDLTVGRIAGAIYSDINRQFPHPPLMLIPALTFKVRKILEQITDLSLFSQSQRNELAKDIRVSIIPILFSFEIEQETIEKIAPMIEAAVLRAMVSLYDPQGTDTI